MWMMTTFGFYSIVAKPGQRAAGLLTVRARVRDDLVRLRQRLLPALGPIEANAGTDYQFRAVAPAADVADAARGAVADIAYGNFKGAVATTLGRRRAHVYADVWSALHKLGDEPDLIPAEVELPPPHPGRPVAFGGVVFDRSGRVLLRRAAGDFGGVRWTFPKGRPEAGEGPLATAVREVRHESGVDAAAAVVIPRWFAGQVTQTLYFVMDAVRDHGDFDPAETSAVRWVAPTDAELLIHASDQPGRSRDLAVLSAAVERRS